MAKRKVTKKPGTKAKAAHLTTGSGAPDIVIRTLENAIGAQVRDYRKHAGLTVSELASVADISSGMLSKIENGQISPSLSTLQLLASALNHGCAARLVREEASDLGVGKRLDEAHAHAGHPDKKGDIAGGSSDAANGKENESRNATGDPERASPVN